MSIDPTTEEMPEVSTTVTVKKSNIKRKLLFIGILIALITASIVTAVTISNIKSEQLVREYLSGKVIIDRYEAESDHWRVFSFTKDEVAMEYWDKQNGSTEGNLSTYVPYDVSVSGLFINISINNEAYRFKWHDEDYDKLRPISDYSDEIEQADFDAEYSRNDFLCDHDYDITVIKAATCEEHGEEHLKCKKCGIEKTENPILPCNYDGNKCTICNKLRKDYRVTADYLYTHPTIDLLQYKNCTIDWTYVTSTSILVHYYMVCGRCHAVDNALQVSEIPLGYQSTKMHTCEECGKITTVLLQVVE